MLENHMVINFADEYERRCPDMSKGETDEENRDRIAIKQRNVKKLEKAKKKLEGEPKIIKHTIGGKSKPNFRH